MLRFGHHKHELRQRDSVENMVAGVRSSCAIWANGSLRATEDVKKLIEAEGGETWKEYEIFKYKR
jgi:hypothetical protein